MVIHHCLTLNSSVQLVFIRGKKFGEFKDETFMQGGCAHREYGRMMLPKKTDMCRQCSV